MIGLLGHGLCKLDPGALELPAVAYWFKRVLARCTGDLPGAMLRLICPKRIDRV